jgi:hypothetical protein
MDGARRFQPDAEAIGEIRGYVRDSLVRRGCADDRIDAAMLCASEVATAALLYGDGRPIDVDLDLTERARVTVGDTPQVDDLPGLLIVNTFADAWGYLPVDGGTAVWFEIDLRDRPAAVEPSEGGRRRSDLVGPA